jgi:hypothetical protein
MKESLMKRIGLIQFVVILLAASLLAGCAPAVATNAVPATPAANTSAAAPNSNPTAPIVNATVPGSTVAPLATATSKSSAASSKDACALLTKADVNKVLGQTFAPVAGTGQYGVCAYTFQLARIDLTISNTDGIQFMKTTRAKLAEMAIDVPGLGDEGLYNINSSTLFVRKGEAVYLLSYLDSMVTQEDKIAKEKVLAGLLLSRIN